MSAPKPKLKRTGVFLQAACLQHRFIRSKDLSNVVERPERLRAVHIGLAAAIARLEELLPSSEEPAVKAGLVAQSLGASETQSLKSGPENGGGSDDDDDDRLVAALGNMRIASTRSSALRDDSLTYGPGPSKLKIPIVQSKGSANLLRDPAVKFVHGDIEGDVYLETLKRWAKESKEKIAQGGSEIPQGYAQGDLYLCPESIVAMEGALGTVCEAVDAVVSTSRGRGGQSENAVERAFVAIRPPGHHCGEDTPSGFCFVNNVAVAAAHAHLKHGINRIVIFDIDLHHGNGTQSIIWQINEETYRLKLEQEAGAPARKLGPQIYYGSIHDVLSYPCEDGKAELVQAASVSLHGPHGQHVENVHLETYTSEEHFWEELYSKKYSRVLRKAEDFLEATGGPGDDVMVFISCGMDACEHEYESMSRHNRKVPTGYYYQFARDASTFADKYAAGRVVSVLEGGYSDRALISASMAHLSGLTDLPSGAVADPSWWSLGNLIELEKATKKRRGGRPSLPAAGSVRPWIERTLAVLAPVDSSAAGSLANLKAPRPIATMTLRDRSKTKTSDTPKSGAGVTTKPRAKGRKSGTPLPTPSRKPEIVSEDSESAVSSGTDQEVVVELDQRQEPVKVRRVILKLGTTSG